MRSRSRPGARHPRAAPVDVPPRHRDLAPAAPGAPALASLTPRERQVLKLLAGGMRPREIAQELAISVKTVEVHKQNLMNKLEIHSAAELTRFAIREGLATP